MMTIGLTGLLVCQSSPQAIPIVPNPASVRVERLKKSADYLLSSYVSAVWLKLEFRSPTPPRVGPSSSERDRHERGVAHGDLCHSRPEAAICGMRDVLIHDYMGVDLDEVWKVASSPIPELREALGQYLGGENPGPATIP
jgi:hypothetical protein